MSFFWSKSRSGKVLEGGLHLLDTALAFGLVSGAVLASIFGKLILAGLLVVIALALVFRAARRDRKSLNSQSGQRL